MASRSRYLISTYFNLIHLQKRLKNLDRKEKIYDTQRDKMEAIGMHTPANKAHFNLPGGLQLLHRALETPIKRSQSPHRESN